MPNATITQVVTLEEARALDKFRQAKAAGRSELRFTFRRNRVALVRLELIEEWDNDGKHDDN